MEFWVFILTVWALARWLQTHIRRKKEDERFARVIDALNHGQARIESLEKRIHNLEHAAVAIPSPLKPAEEILSRPAPTPVAKAPEPPATSPIPPWPSEPKEVPASPESLSRCFCSPCWSASAAIALRV